MGEQERYKNMLQEIITATENQQIQTSEELIRTLVRELTNTVGVRAEYPIVK